MQLATEHKLTIATLLGNPEVAAAIDAAFRQEAAEWRSRAFSNTFSKLLDRERRLDVIIEQNAKAAAYENALTVLRQSIRETASENSGILSEDQLG